MQRESNDDIELQTVIVKFLAINFPRDTFALQPTVLLAVAHMDLISKLVEETTKLIKWLLCVYNSTFDF